MYELFISFFVLSVVTVSALFIIAAFTTIRQLHELDSGMFSVLRRWTVLSILIVIVEFIITAWLYQFTFYHYFLGDLGVILTLVTCAVLSDALLQQSFKLLDLGQRTKWNHLVGKAMKRLNICEKFSPSAKLNQKKVFLMHWLILLSFSLMFYVSSAYSVTMACVFSAVYLAFTMNVVLFLGAAILILAAVKETKYEKVSKLREWSDWMFSPAFNLLGYSIIYFAFAIAQSELNHLDT